MCICTFLCFIFSVLPLIWLAAWLNVRTSGFRNLMRVPSKNIWPFFPNCKVESSIKQRILVLWYFHQSKDISLRSSETESSLRLFFFFLQDWSSISDLFWKNKKKNRFSYTQVIPLNQVCDVNVFAETQTSAALSPVFIWFCYVYNVDFFCVRYNKTTVNFCFSDSLLFSVTIPTAFHFLDVLKLDREVGELECCI